MIDDSKHTESVSDKESYFDKLNHFQKRSKKLENIELIEKGVDDIYYWRELFCKKRPASNYTKYLPSTKKIENEKIIKPIPLIDEKEEKIRDIFDIDMVRETKNEYGFAKANCTDPKKHAMNECVCKTFNKINKDKKRSKSANFNSVYQERSDSSIYFLSKEYSEYFKMDLKEFAEKFALLHPKLKIDKKNIRKTLEYINEMNNENNAKINQIKEPEDIKFNKRHLYLATTR